MEKSKKHRRQIKEEGGWSGASVEAERGLGRGRRRRRFAGPRSHTPGSRTLNLPAMARMRLLGCKLTHKTEIDIVTHDAMKTRPIYLLHAVSNSKNPLGEY